MARQYFNSSLADSAIVSASTGSITSLTGIFTPAQANQFFPLPFGVNGGPFAGQVFRFTAGGLFTTGTTGTMIITAVHGPSTAQVALTAATVLATSATITYAPSITNGAWRMEGDLVYRTISNAATVSTAWIVGQFIAQGVTGTAGYAFVIPFSSTAAVSVDTTGAGSLGSYGALNFGITFSVASTVTAQYTCMQALN
jgi:hypothetical protein